LCDMRGQRSDRDLLVFEELSRAREAPREIAGARVLTIRNFVANSDVPATSERHSPDSRRRPEVLRWGRGGESAATVGRVTSVSRVAVIP